MNVQSMPVALVASLALAVLVAVLTPAGALAQRDGRTRYEGTHDAGGTVRFTVSSDSTRIVALELEGIAGGGCSWDTIDLTNWGGSIELAENGFAATNADGDTIRGEFPAPFQAEGTLEVTDPARGCSTGPLRWAATMLVPTPDPTP